MPRTTKPLTSTEVSRTTAPGKLYDGNGLALIIAPSGAKRWIQRIKVNGRTREIGLGPLDVVSLAAAREQARKNRALARDGIDPIERRESQRGKLKTFRAIADEYIERQAVTWTNPKTPAQWRSSLEDYVDPIFGGLPVSEVSQADVMRAISPIWHTKQETARRVHRRVSAILDFAAAKGLREGENPARLAKIGLGKQTDQRKHHSAMPIDELPGFYQRLVELESLGPVAALAFRFLILNASRTTEVLKATWSEIDLEAARWTIPSERMKTRKEHLVPLSDEALAVLHKAAKFRKLETPNAFVFPGQRLAPLSNMALSMALRRMEVADVTVHGFRSTFRDWVSERTTVQGEIAEAALAHTVKNAVEAAYRRSTMLEKRRQLMGRWAGFVTGADAAQVVEIRA